MTAKRISARLEPNLALKVAAVQRRTGKSVATVVREAIETYCDAQLAESPNALNALTASGLVGCAIGPSDLAERYKNLLP